MEDVRKRSITTQIPTGVNMGVYTAALTPRIATPSQSQLVTRRRKITKLIGGSGRQLTRRAPQQIFIPVRSVAVRTYGCKEGDNDVGREGETKGAT